MRTGLVLGKFMPIHQGHLALIRYARRHCDRLIVLVCANDREPIPGPLRLSWAERTLAGEPGIKVHYTNVEMPEADESSRLVSKAWADYLSRRFPEITLFCSSEKYGDYVAEYMGITHLPFDPPRQEVPVSARLIREQPFRYWDYIPWPVRPYYVKKVCLYGAESTGKSTLAERLAQHFQTNFVPEAARTLLTTSLECTYEDLLLIAKTQAQGVEQSLPSANKLLFCDTDLLTTKVYAQYLFRKVPVFEPWIEALNQYDLHLFLDTDVPYEQDGTRLGSHTRPALHDLFLDVLKKADTPFVIINGDWEQRFLTACRMIEERFGV
jgi:HTH-type transcriptional repressor of NAD biosynthesis genes